MELEISPEPSAEERAAILAALAQEAQATASAWPRTVLPQQVESEEP